MQHFVFCFCIALLSVSAQANIKKWQDAKGQWHFEDDKSAINHPSKAVSPQARPAAPSAAVLPKGQLILRDTSHGTFYHYQGRSAGAQLKLLVINHGMFSEKKDEFIAAKQMLEPWFTFADEYGATHIAPVFDNSAFAVTKHDSADGGYRGLFGRDINADEFLHEIIAQYENSVKNYDGRFYLIGHSAGAQFANRYSVRHPQRVIAAAYSAPAWFAFPDPKLRWPLGMGRRTYKQAWVGRSQDKLIDIQPQPSWWIHAAQIPCAVVVGEKDLEPLRHVEHVGGDNHVERAKYWVASMNKFAAERGVKSTQHLVLVANTGHEYQKLAPALQNFIRQFF